VSPPPTPDPTDPVEPVEPVDPVLVRRAQIAHYIRIAQRIGYALFGLFMVLIIIGFSTRFPSGITSAATACLVLGSVILGPAMILAYTVKAADRADREGDWR